MFIDDLLVTKREANGQSFWVCLHAFRAPPSLFERTFIRKAAGV